MKTNKIVEMKAINKSFGTNKVLHDVDFSLERGTIHALLGENGAGKSTLMNILGNVVAKDSGAVFINGREIDYANAANAVKDTIAHIHQELSLVGDLNIFENLFLGKEIKKGFWLDKKAMRKGAHEILSRISVDINPDTLISELNPSFKQIVEIARALMKNSRVIIMDEPTTALTDVEIDSIFKVMNTLRNHGVSLIFISHKLNEVIRICDSYTIMRDGKIAATGKVTAGTTEKELSTYMAGKEVRSNDIYKQRKIGGVLLEIKNLSKEREYRVVNMYVRKGEIVGVTGLLGDGRSDLFASVYGANSPYEGDIFMNGVKTVMSSTVVGKNNKIFYLPKNRKENSIIKDFSIEENVVLPIMKNISSKGIIDKNKQRKLVQNYAEKLSIRVNDTKNLITSLSGGNQQKVVLSKALCTEPEILILDNPTQGVDVGAKIEIYRQIIELAEQGLSFVILSNEIPELQKLCDRVYVMFNGEVRHEFSHGEITEEKIMIVATGGKIGQI